MAPHVINFKDVGELKTLPKFKKKKNTVPIGIKTPLSLGERELFSMHLSLEEQIKDNFKNLILTNHGERLGRFDYGANLFELTLEFGREDFEAEIARRIKTAVSKFMPFIELGTMTTKINHLENVDGLSHIDLLITYDIPTLSVKNSKIEVLFSIAG